MDNLYIFITQLHTCITTSNSLNESLTIKKLSNSHLMCKIWLSVGRVVRAVQVPFLKLMTLSYSIYLINIFT